MRLMRAAVLTALPTLLTVGTLASVGYSDTHQRPSTEVRHQQFIDPPWSDNLTSFSTHLLPEPSLPDSDEPPTTVTVASSRPTSYTVVEGDSLWSIAASHGVNMDNLALANHMNLWDLLLPGRVLTLPDPNQAPPATPLPLYAPVQHVVAAVAAPEHTSYTPAPVSTPVVTQSYSLGGVWGCIAQHESGGNPAEDTGNGFYGAFQFTISSWEGAGGGPGLPSNYSYATQLAVAQRLQQMQGWGAWPNTSRMCGV
jgi:LysM repeat protein